MNCNGSTRKISTSKYQPSTNTQPASVEIKPRPANKAISGWLCEFIVTSDKDQRHLGACLSREFPTGVAPALYFAGQNNTLADELLPFIDETPPADKHFVLSGVLLREKVSATEQRHHITYYAVLKCVLGNPLELVEIPTGQIMETSEGVI